ncbi:MAG: patatin-like phospholipase family protein [Bacteroidota bacterium]
MASWDVCKVGIALSGGGARGIAHMGVLQALEDLGIQISHVSGTSMGAIIGAMYAAGIPPLGMKEVLKHDRFLTEMSMLKLGSKGLLKMDLLYQKLDKYIGRDEISGTRRKLFIGATNLHTGEYTIFEEGPLYKVVAASAALPIIFEPQEIQGELYLDGGLTNNLPVDPLEEVCDFIIGVHVNFQKEWERIDKMQDILSRVFSITIKQNVEARLNRCDLQIEPPDLHDCGIFDFDKVDILWEAGYERTMAIFQGRETPLTAESLMVFAQNRKHSGGIDH